MQNQNDETPGDVTDADFELVSSDPAMFYESPAAIAAATDISSNQKLRLLNGWRQDITDTQTASSEGMIPPAGTPVPVRAITLEDVNAAVAQVEAAGPTAPSLAVRTLWQRLVGVD